MKKQSLLYSLVAMFLAISANQVSLASTNSTKQFTRSDNKLALHQNTEVICGDGATTYVRAQTKGYYINICGNSNGPNQYLGAGKSGQTIILPLKSYSDGEYVATSGNIRYILNSRYLTVKQSGRTILKQKIISWR